MSVEIIYEKKYPRIDPMEEMKQIELEMADEPEEPTPSFEEIMQKIQENTTYVLMPERIKASENFIQAAIEVSELYELDTKIERHFDHISVNYSFNCCGGLRYLVWQTSSRSLRIFMDGTLQSPLISLPTPHFGTEGLYLRKQSVAPFNYSSEPNAHPQNL